MIEAILILAGLLLVAKGRGHTIQGNGNWRIYRLPGSRDKWHVDNGDGTPVVNIHSYDCRVPSRSVDRGDGVPRAWIEIDAKTSVLKLSGDRAVWVPYAPECKSLTVTNEV